MLGFDRDYSVGAFRANLTLRAARGQGPCSFATLPDGRCASNRRVLIKACPSAIQKRPANAGLFCMAEGQGFEPWEVLPSLVFKTSAFDHSATLISHAGAVGGVIVVSIHAEFVSSSHRNLCDKGHEVVWDIIWVFANFT